MAMKKKLPRTGPSSKNAKPARPDVNVFIAEYLTDGIGRRAAIAAGYSPATAASQASRLLKSVKVRSEIAKVRARVSAKVEDATGIRLTRIVRELAAIALTDTRELCEYIVGACRHCHGVDFGYQSTVAEMNCDYEKWLAMPRKRVDEFDERGGIGFDPKIAPHPECPECAGRGIGVSVIKDTRNFSPGALALYAGVKQTKDGLQVLMHSKDAALEKLMRHLGGYAVDNKQKQSTFAEALAAFVGEIHASGGSRLPIRPPGPSMP